MRKTVSTRFLLALEKQYPGLNKNVSYKRFMRYLIFGLKETSTGLSLIDGYHVAKANNMVPAFRSNNHTGKKFLLKFQKDVMTHDTFSWSGWDSKKGQARVAYIKFPAHIQELIDKEIRMVTTNFKDKVYFDTGKKVQDYTRKVDREIIKQEAFTYFEFAVPEAKPLLSYMNNLSVRPFIKVIKANMDAALGKAIKIEEPIKMRTQLEILATLSEDLQPFYKPSEKGHTDRIFPCNYSIPMLRREVRKVLTRGWYEFDLANSQLAIIAKLWDIQIVQDYLKTNTSIWPELFKHYKCNYQTLKLKDELKYNTMKDVFKTSLYSLVYGMSKYYLIKEITDGLKHLGISKAGQHFFKHPLIQAIEEAKQLKVKELNELTEVETIFGINRIIYGSKTLKGTPTKERLDSINSILAHQAQSVELYLLLPVVELASTTKDFYITLWQHDGFSVHFTNKTKVDYWIKKIQSAVQSKIDEQGILTHLEWELL